MTDAKFSDIDKKVYPLEECFTVQVKDLKTKQFLEFDIHQTQKEERIKDAMQLAFQNGKRWMQWKQVKQPDGTNKLTKVLAGTDVTDSSQQQVV